MIKIAMINPWFLPVPAVKGGAVEVLATHLIKGNEVEGNAKIDVFTIPDPSLDNIRYKNSKIIQVVPKWIIRKSCGAWNKLVGNRTIDKKITAWQVVILGKLLKNSYDYILIENDMIMCERICRVFKNNKRVKIIYHLHNDYDVEAKTPELVNAIAPRTNIILTVSDYIKKRILKSAPNANVKVLYNAIDIKAFEDKTMYRNKIRNQYNIGNNDFVFIYSGRITEEKGVLELFKAFEILKNEKGMDNCKLLVVGKAWFGEDELTSYEKNLMDIMKNRTDIILTGFVLPSQMPEVLAAADAAVIPSKWEEPFGLVVLEAMASGLQIVATNSGAITEIIDESMAEIVDKEKNLVINLYIGMKNCVRLNEKKIRLKKHLDKHPEFNSRFYYKNFCKAAGIPIGERKLEN